MMISNWLAPAAQRACILARTMPILPQPGFALGQQAIIGVSCYDSLDRARSAVKHGADYVAFGAFHSSSTKPLAQRASPEILRAAKALGVPMVAIGGITPDNAAALIDAGADCVAVISSLFDAEDIEAVARKFSQLFP